MGEQAKKTNRLIEQCTDNLEASPDDVQALSLRGWAWLKKKDYDAAIADFDKALSFDAHRIDALHNRGRAFGEKGEHDLAIKDFTEALACSPPQDDLVHIHYNRGRSRHLSGANADAVKDFKEAVRLDPLHAKAFRMLGRSWVELGEDRHAVAALDHAIAIDPKSANAYHTRGNAWVCLGKLRKAIADFTYAIQLDPNHSDNAATHSSRGVAWIRKGQFAKAIADYERALEIEPDSPQRHLVLGGFLACCPDGRYRDGDRALKLMTRACELTNFADAEQLNLLAAAHAECGDFDSAIAVLQTALTLETDDEDEQDARFCLELYQAGKPWRMDPPKWWQRFK